MAVRSCLLVAVLDVQLAIDKVGHFSLLSVALELVSLSGGQVGGHFDATLPQLLSEIPVTQNEKLVLQATKTNNEGTRLGVLVLFSSARLAEMVCVHDVVYVPPPPGRQVIKGVQQLDDVGPVVFSGQLRRCRGT